MERRFLTQPVKVTSRAEGNTPIIDGVGAVFYDGTPETEYVLWEFPGERCVERIMKGAFEKVLSRPDDVRGLFNHDPNNVLGRTASGTMKLSIDRRGLIYEIEADPEAPLARQVLSTLKRGDVSGSSIAFIVDEEEWSETKTEGGVSSIIRRIKSVTLFDTGPVTYPAYESTTSAARGHQVPDMAIRAIRADDKVGESRAAYENWKSTCEAVAARKARLKQIDKLEAPTA